MDTKAQDWQLVERLFHEAVELPRADRTAFLDAQCGADIRLRREVDSLLSADDREAASIESAVGSEASAFLATREKRVGDLTGSRLGPYRIVREIGRSGMGSVYLAVRDDDEYRQQVAIKLIRHGMDTADVLERFRHERQILANLDHPYIARLLDGGTSPDGRPFLVMEHVTGKALDEWTRERAERIPPGHDIGARLELFLKVCEAVSHAHRKLVVHRDLKPANIFITPDGSPKLLDFGVAKLLEADVSARTTATAIHGRPLTPDYASPEQLRGGQITTSADVYSLGAILYELLCGVKAHQFRNHSAAEIERVICEADPPLPSEAAPAMRSRLRGDADAIVSMAMRKEPDRRYQSVEQLAADVRAFREGRAVYARQGNLAYRAGKYVRRNRTPIAVGFLFILALVGGAVTATVQAIRANREQAIAEEARRQAVASQLRAEASQRNAELQAAEADKARGEAVTQGHEAELQKALAESEKQLADRRFDQVRQMAGKFVVDFHNAIAALPGSTPARKMVVETGLQYYNAILKDAGGNRGLLEEIARGYDSLGDVQGNPYYANLGDIPGAIASYERAVAIRKGIADPSPAFQAERVRGQVKLSQVLVAKGDLPGAGRVNGEAIALGEATLASLGPGRQSYEVRNALANAYSAYGDLKIRLGTEGAAVEPYLRLMALAESAARDRVDERQEQVGLSLAHTKLGDAYYRNDRAPESVAELRKALAIDKSLADASPSNMQFARKLYITYSLLGRALHLPGGMKVAQPGEIGRYLTAARDLAVEMSAADPNNATAFTDLAVAETGLGDWLVEQHEPEKAIEEFSRAIPAAERTTRMQPGGPLDILIQVHHRMATGLNAAARYGEALESVRRGESYLEQEDRRTPGTVRNATRRMELLRARGEAYMGLREWDNAVSVWRQIRAIGEERLSRDPANLRFRDEQPLAAARLAECYEGLGQPQLARPEFARAAEEFRGLEARRPLDADETKLRDEARAKSGLAGQP